MMEELFKPKPAEAELNSKSVANFLSFIGAKVDTVVPYKLDAFAPQGVTIVRDTDVEIRIVAFTKEYNLDNVRFRITGIRGDGGSLRIKLRFKIRQLTFNVRLHFILILP